MRKFTVLILCAFLLAGCGTYTGSGAYTGGYFGSILGSAIGGITNGPRGSDVGTIVGMVGGAVVGAAIGNAADNADKREVHEHYENVQRNKQNRQNQQNQNGSYNHDDEGYFDPNNSGDDRLYDFDNADYSNSERYALSAGGSEVQTLSPGSDGIEIRNVRFLDENEDGAINSNEMCRIVFEVYNHTSKTLYNLQPVVNELSGSKRIFISPSVSVSRLEPNKGIRYTAMVNSMKMKNGNVRFNVAVLHNNKVVSNITEFAVATAK